MGLVQFQPDRFRPDAAEVAANALMCIFILINYSFPMMNEHRRVNKPQMQT